MVDNQQILSSGNRQQSTGGPLGSELIHSMNQGATTSVNDRIDIKTLKGTNWIDWKWQILNILDLRGLKDVLVSAEPVGTHREKAARQIVSSTLDHLVVNKVIHCHSVQEIRATLTGIYENRTSFALTDLLGRTNSYRMNSLDQVENGISEIRSMAINSPNPDYGWSCRFSCCRECHTPCSTEKLQRIYNLLDFS